MLTDDTSKAVAASRDYSYQPEATEEGPAGIPPVLLSYGKMVVRVHHSPHDEEPLARHRSAQYRNAAQPRVGSHGFDDLPDAAGQPRTCRLHRTTRMGINDSNR